MCVDELSGREFYKEQVRFFGPVYEALGFDDRNSSVVSFLQLGNWVRPRFDFAKLSLLDVGSGIGSALNIFSSWGYPLSCYGAVEPNSDFLGKTRSETGDYPAELEYRSDITLIEKEYELSIAMNVMSYFTGSQEQAKEFFISLVREMAKRSTKGVAINCISPFDDWKGKGNVPIPIDFAVSVMKSIVGEDVVVDLSECANLMFLGAKKNYKSIWRKQNSKMEV